MVRDSNPHGREAITVFGTDEHSFATIRGMEWRRRQDSNLHSREALDA